MPMGLKLEPHQFFGQQTPYANEEESEIEESDDEEFFEGVSNSQFREFVKSQVKQILQSQYTMECALVDIKRMKHTYSKGDQLCQAAIYPTVLEVANDKITDGMKPQEKLDKIKETLSFFKQMLKTFVTTEEDQANVIYLVALFCSKNPKVTDCFHLFIQLLHDPEDCAILDTQSIVDWIDSTKDKIAKGEPEQEESEGGSSSDQDSEGPMSSGSDEDEPLELAKLTLFMAKLAKFESHLRE